MCNKQDITTLVLLCFRNFVTVLCKMMSKILYFSYLLLLLLFLHVVFSYMYYSCYFERAQLYHSAHGDEEACVQN